MVNSKFIISCTSDKIWNYNELLDFLIANQQGHIRIDIQPEAICLQQIGVYDLLDKFSFARVDIETWNPLENHAAYNIIYKGSNFWFRKIERIDPLLHTWNQNKLFYCLFGRPTASRLGLCAYLLAQHSSKSHLHFSASVDDDELVHYELDKLLTYKLTSVAEAGMLINKLPLLLSPSDRYTKYNGYDYSDPLTDLYQDIFIDVLAESHVLGNTFFPTEKTTRPMWLKKPFIVFGSRNYLDYLHQMGFKTFNDFWSEDYDGFEGRDRFVKILNLLDTIANKPISELQQMYQGMQNILDHNYNLLSKQTYKTHIVQIT